MIEKKKNSETQTAQPSSRANCYVASYPNSTQIGPNTFEELIETKICGHDTTLGEIHEWMRQRTKFNNVELFVYISQAT